MANKTFHLGLCMAGAITAGSYTAGVVDYLLETLELWQQQKEANKQASESGQKLPFEDTPMYDVRLDVISGASAGGMCAAITTAMVVEGFTLEDLRNKRSKMYKAWIDLDDDGVKEGTIKKMLSIDDINDEGVVSILNSRPLQSIAERTIKPIETVKTVPYIDRKLDTVLSLANLRGARYHIEFSAYGRPKKHHMTLHRDFMHFKLNENETDQSDFLSMDFSSAGHLKLFRESAVATGAFPVGLRARELTRSSRYYYNKANVTVGISDIDTRKLNVTLKRGTDDAYHSMNIDGGTFNNEPFGETEKILNKKAGKSRGEDIDAASTNRAILMVDPFPTNDNHIDQDDLKPGILNIAPRIIAALRSQSSFKAKDLVDALSDNNYQKFLIIPSDPNSVDPLCCASMGAFGGFLYKPFREHDYQLGRRNAQQFLRKHFVFPFSPGSASNNSIHQGWSQSAIDIYKESDSEQQFLPIIPDLRKGDPSSVIPQPKMPKYPISKLRELEDLLDIRIRAILDAIETVSNEKKEQPDVVKEYFRKSKLAQFFGNAGSFIARPIVGVILSQVKKKVREAAVKAAITWILSDLHERGLLEEPLH